MLGTAESLFELAGASLEPAERALHERTTAALGARLGGARLAQLRAEGKRMTLDDALAHAARS
jgi:hypothetical protein